VLNPLNILNSEDNRYLFFFHLDKIKAVRPINLSNNWNNYIWLYFICTL